MIEQPVEEPGGLFAEETLCCSRVVGTLDEIVVYGAQGLETSRGDAVQAVVSKGELAVAALYAGAGALEQVRAFLDRVIDDRTTFRGEAWEGCLRVGTQPLREIDKRDASVSGCRFSRRTIQVCGRYQMLLDDVCLLQRQIEHADAFLDLAMKESHGTCQRRNKSVCFLNALETSLGQ